MSTITAVDRVTVAKAEYQQCKVQFKQLSLVRKIQTIFFSIIACFTKGRYGFYSTFATKVRIYSPKVDVKKPGVFETLLTNPKFNSPQVQILIDIGDTKGLKLTENNLSEIFSVINEFTINKPYSHDPSQKLDSGNKIIFRPGHNGVHSARQARYVEVLFDMVLSQSPEPVKQIMRSLSEEEKLNLKLGAFLLRAGRAGEFNHLEDDYIARSTMIYEAYARQLGVNPSTLQWMRKILINNSKPKATADAEVLSDPKASFCLDLLNIAHQIDLVRCFDPVRIQLHVKDINAGLGRLIPDPNVQTAVQEKLLQFAINACLATGDRVSYKNKPNFNLQKFELYSFDGKQCWKQVKQVAVPNWN